MTTRKSVIGSLASTDLCVFAAYVAMLCVFVPYHEPWGDEAQAWLLCRDLSFHSLIFHHLRYEGHPALWYALLWVPTHLHMSYGLFNWLSAAIASVGIYVFLRFAPFPFYLRAVLPFTFFFAYEYAVVARSYVLFPLLGFLVATVYRLQRPRPVLMAVVLGLLANLSIHGTIVAISFAALYVRDAKLRTPDPARPSARRKEMLFASAIFVSSVAFVAICLWPVSDSIPRLTPTLNSLLSHITINVSPSSKMASPAIVPMGVTALPDSSVYSHGWHNTSAHAWARIQNLASVLSYAFALSQLAALAFEVLVVVYLFRAGKIRFVLPFVLLCIFLAFVYAAPWHLGLLWVTCIIILWIAWDEKIPLNECRVQNIVAASLATLCICQIGWSAKTFEFDLYNQTSPDKAAANFLHTLPSGMRIAGTAADVQPYFDHNIFINQNETFIDFRDSTSGFSLRQATSQHPDIFVVKQPDEKTLSASNYHVMNVFCGALYFRNAPLSPDCIFILGPEIISNSR